MMVCIEYMIMWLLHAFVSQYEMYEYVIHCVTTCLSLCMSLREREIICACVCDCVYIYMYLCLCDSMWIYMGTWQSWVTQTEIGKGYLEPTSMYSALMSCSFHSEYLHHLCWGCYQNHRGQYSKELCSTMCSWGDNMKFWEVLMCRPSCQLWFCHYLTLRSWNLQGGALHKMEIGFSWSFRCKNLKSAYHTWRIIFSFTNVHLHFGKQNKTWWYMRWLVIHCHCINTFNVGLQRWQWMSHWCEFSAVL